MNFLDYTSILNEADTKVLKTLSNFCRSYNELLNILLQDQLKSGINFYGAQSKFISTTIDVEKLIKPYTLYKCGIALDKNKLKNDYSSQFKIKFNYNDTYRDLFSATKPVILKALFENNDNYYMILNQNSYSVPIQITYKLFDYIVDAIMVNYKDCIEYYNDTTYKYERAHYKSINLQCDGYIVTKNDKKPIILIGEDDSTNDTIRVSKRVKKSAMTKGNVIILRDNALQDFKNSVDEGEVRFCMPENTIVNIDNISKYLRCIYMPDIDFITNININYNNLEIDPALLKAIDTKDYNYIKHYTNNEELVKFIIMYAHKNNINVKLLKNLNSNI